MLCNLESGECSNARVMDRAAIWVSEGSGIAIDRAARAALVNGKAAYRETSTEEIFQHRGDGLG